ncbi:conserved hypothetical protein [Histoplasma capsulatum var. duboisii H88]|uniref:DUF866 domain-containing protein n=1 Tax=Ajellomyces capsulatus (strain H88) TaxID=544711 RepID=F0UVV7_AJEC8|nr:conserved hypothetical protein [Histoplasma capsulatum var. duboisii H88]QSS50767.1 hypothetical protein I7I53_05904 [Histoplasma capsulatum var. duboisii H88]
MPSSVSTTQLKFLKSSAQYLAAQSPSTSSHLLSVHNQLLRDELKLLSVAQHREFCGACGTARTADSSKTIALKNHNGVLKRPKKEASSTEPSPIVIYRCLRCHRQKILTSKGNIKPLNPRKPRLGAAAPSAQTSIQSARVDAPIQGIESTSTTTLQKSTDNHNSKRRAKIRKQQGLMAALAAGKKQHAQSQTSSLDLLDFLKH